MAKVFVSYSRKDIEFAKRLTAELEKSELDFWIDWEGIPPTVDWWKEIEKGIEEADVFLFLISPDSAASKICGREIDVAVKNGKRLIPLVVRDINGDDVPPQLGQLNWIFIRESDDFNAALHKLLTAIHTDFEWVQIHRRLQVKALEWQRNSRENSFLLRGKDLRDADYQFSTNSSKEPYPTNLQQDYIFESRTVEDRQRRTARRLRIAISVIGVVLLSLFFLAQSGLLNRFIYQPVDMKEYWVTIPAGEFQMGSEAGDRIEQPVHSVYLDDYQIGKYEITNRQYTQCVKAGYCRPPANKIYALQEYELHPVTSVSWNDANDYCEWVGGGLPTEAEWEKAASWDAKTRSKFVYPWGDHIDCSYANYHGKDDGRASCLGHTSPVGSYESGKSPYGLYDMAGNVWEWVNDWYDSTYYQISPSSNPMGPPFGDARVFRGGSWDAINNGARSSTRAQGDPGIVGYDYGFRCSRSP